MSSATVNRNWKHTVLYLTLIISLIYSIETLISHKLHINHTNIRLKRSPNLPLRFRDDGTFKILQVADMHYGMGSITRCRDVVAAEFDYCSDLNTTRFLRRMIQAEKPDLIAFTGDNIFGSSTTDAAESLLEAIGPAIEYGIPWAAVLGNHDQESTLNRLELMTFLSLMDFSVSQINPPVGGDGELRLIDGFGNYQLRVHGAPGSVLSNSTVFDLFFLDSGDRETFQGRRTYGWIKDSQLRWLQDTSKQGHNQSIAGNHHPALAFFHIPILEVRDLWYTPFIGQFQEGVACSIVQSGVLKTFLSMGNVKAAFIGHDHVNDFCGNLKGVWFCYGGGFGYHAYGRPNWHRRARVIEAELGKGRDTWTGVELIRTWKRLDDEDLSKIDEQVLWEASYTSYVK
ncbi:putative inactive purple acid phosphatase 28 [Raphanus sativus]|uniref:Probable inactive purple acid phosphatase 28 isoform X1 n=1 Tax=Raphanus sativus TaxID=3726 RepID=A0A6J0LWR4_RAPSA|nr:probable inactive purple acid phosphatase 28 isoform X1 [Raphanus sativus]XP_056858604.1 probable inactive purple acid phosphatase 28 isoform X1 [Raphanus sativus]KAJ4911185.1 putative inactive purple acid phosphatase 28 [Raphanus sativus]